MREHKRLTPIVDKYREYVRLKSQIADAEEILAGGDAELTELAEVELTDFD